jgi:hypothetical protein
MMVRRANAIRPAEPALQQALLAMSTPNFIQPNPACTETTSSDGAKTPRTVSAEAHWSSKEAFDGWARALLIE